MGCAALGVLSRAAGTSCSCELLWSHHSSSSPGSQTCAFEPLSGLRGCRSSQRRSCPNTWLSGCCFILCKSTELLATCNTQLGLRHPGSLQDSAQLVLGHKVPCWNGHPLPFSPYEVQQSRIREFVTSWAGTALLPECMVWLTGCRDVCGACLHLIIVLPFPFFLPFPFSQSYLLHGHSV